MGKAIVSRTTPDFQLVSVGIELVHKVFGLMDCSPELANNPHVVRANECANRWNELFIKFVTSAKPVGK